MAGWNDWNTSDVVTATQFQDLLQDQVIMVFADATARDAAVSGANLAEGMHAYLSDTDTLTYYTGAAWANAVAPTSGSIQEFLSPLNPAPGVILSPGAPTQNQIYFYPLPPVSVTTTVTGIVHRVGTQNGNIDLGIYSWDGTTMTKVATTGSTACPAAGGNNTALSATLNPGTRYCIAFITDSASASWVRDNPGSVMAHTWPLVKTSQSIPLATSYTTITTQLNGVAPAVRATVLTGMALT
jgi:hypothetical protein